MLPTRVSVRIQVFRRKTNGLCLVNFFKINHQQTICNISHSMNRKHKVGVKSLQLKMSKRRKILLCPSLSLVLIVDCINSGQSASNLYWFRKEVWLYVMLWENDPTLLIYYVCKRFPNEFMVSVTSFKTSSPKHDVHYVNNGPRVKLMIKQDKNKLLSPPLAPK